MAEYQNHPAHGLGVRGARAAMLGAGLLAGVSLAAASAARASDEPLMPNTVISGIETAIGDGIAPSAFAMAEETCVVSDVVADHTDSFFARAAFEVGLGIVREHLTKRSGAGPMFCDQDFAGLLVTTDRLMVRSIDEVAQGIDSVNQALGFKAIDISKTLKMVQRARPGSLSGLQSGDIKATVTFIGAASVAIAAAVERRIEQGGLSDDTVRLLLKSIQHLSNAAYLRGKLITAGYIIKQAFSDIGGAHEAANLALQATGMKREFFEDLPENLGGLVLATARNFVLIELIEEVRDDDDFETALYEVKNPERAMIAEVNAEAAEIQSKYGTGGTSIAAAADAENMGGIFGKQ